MQSIHLGTTSTRNLPSREYGYVERDRDVGRYVDHPLWLICKGNHREGGQGRMTGDSLNPVINFPLGVNDGDITGKRTRSSP